MSEQQKDTKDLGVQEVSWLDKEWEAYLDKSEYPRFPKPEFREGKITVVKIDASEPFDEQEVEGTKKKIIKCSSVIEGEFKECRWWLNVRNPIYKELLRLCKEAEDKKQVEVCVLQTGTGMHTKYQLVER